MMPICPKCGSPYQIGQHICHNCNAKLIEDPLQRFPILGDPPQIPPPGSPPDMYRDEDVNPYDPRMINPFKKRKKHNRLF
jgi:hypothetical protein